MKFSDLEWKLLPMESPPSKPKPLPLAIVHAKSGAKVIRLGKATRDALRNPAYVQVVINHEWLAIRAAAKGDQHARQVSPASTFPAIELVRMCGTGAGARMALTGTLNEGHIVAALPKALKANA